VSHPFRAAVEAKDLDAMFEQLADDVSFRSPVVFKPYEGKEAVSFLLSLVVQVFEDFEYVDELEGERDGHKTIALVFRANVGDKSVDGWDYFTLNDDGKIQDFMVMVRPMSGMHALAEAMKAKLEAAETAAAG
jgi:hypothetical protein